MRFFGIDADGFKLKGNVLFAKELARRYEKELISISLNPGMFVCILLDSKSFLLITVNQIGNLNTDLPRHTIVPRWVKALIVRVLFR